MPSPSDPPKLSLLPSAYEDKQKLKRTEIISRSWFPATPSPGTGSSKASSMLKKLAQGRRAGSPACAPITVGDLGIVRRRSREVPGSPQHTTSPLVSGERQRLQSNPQDGPVSPEDCSPDTAESPNTSLQQRRKGSGQDEPRSPSGSSQEADAPHPSCSSLVADYSDSESSE